MELVTTSNSFVLSADCSDLLNSGIGDGVYVLGRTDFIVTRVFCDMTTAGGPWTVHIISLILFSHYLFFICRAYY